jgi:UDP-glucose 4-epimerase
MATGTILVTGGLGFIGSHTITSLADQNEDIVIIDNLSNSEISVLDRIKNITGKKYTFYEGDVRDTDLIYEILRKYKISSVFHFAGLKAVGESVLKPLEYFDCNVSGAISLFKAMQLANVKRLIFSSSCTVYGNNSKSPINENTPRSSNNPYGRTKLMIEEMLEDISHDHSWSIARLRYFNPIGAHPSFLIGEKPNGTPNNLMPYLTQVASGKLECLNVFGGDYPTPDGSGIRDYIHVMDLADGHVSAFKYIQDHQGLNTFNLGTGHGTSVLNLIQTFEEVNKIKVSFKIVDRRLGDISEIYADTSLASKVLNWRAKRTLRDMCHDSWQWQLKLNGN